MKIEIQYAQELLYTWISNFEKRSYNSIRNSCAYIDESMGLNLGEHSVWRIFMPLVYSGLIEYIGHSYYATTKPIAVEIGDTYVYNSIKSHPTGYMKDIPFIFATKSKKEIEGMDTYKINPISVLKQYPSIDKIVDSFPESFEDLSSMEYYNKKAKQGLTKPKLEGMMRHFHIPSKSYQREVPDMSVNPDAFQIALYYSRVVNNEPNGYYSKETETLKLNAIGIPIMIYRILMLESLASMQYPTLEGTFYFFKNISKETIKELQTILCNSIVYE